jgi:preprotein translocase subunit SecD
VGASLGADSIREGVTAAVVGVLVVMAFMLVYYKGSGINADLALFLNLVILLGFMGFSRGYADTAGHCRRDSDDRHGRGLERADLRAHPGRDAGGQSGRGGSRSGLWHAWVTIFDTHVTTIVSAAILFMFGSGPVKGFAVTLTFGLRPTCSQRLCFAGDLRLASGQVEVRRADFDLETKGLGAKGKGPKGLGTRD